MVIAQAAIPALHFPTEIAQFPPLRIAVLNLMAMAIVCYAGKEATLTKVIALL
jgi:hypothetical protein